MGGAHLLALAGSPEESIAEASEVTYLPGYMKLYSKSEEEKKPKEQFT